MQRFCRAIGGFFAEIYIGYRLRVSEFFGEGQY
jgi:hypothetical protein